MCSVVLLVDFELRELRPVDVQQMPVFLLGLFFPRSVCQVGQGGPELSSECVRRGSGAAETPNNFGLLVGGFGRPLWSREESFWCFRLILPPKKRTARMP